MALPSLRVGDTVPMLEGRCVVAGAWDRVRWDVRVGVGDRA